MGDKAGGGDIPPAETRLLVAPVLILSILDWLGWASGQQALTRVFPDWPQMTPWTAALLGAAAISFLAQSGRPSPSRVWLARALPCCSAA